MLYFILSKIRINRNMIELIIVGTGGLGREIFSWLSQTVSNKKDLHIKGFIDDNQNSLDGYDYPIKIIGNIDDYQPQSNEALVVAIMNPKIKAKIVGDLLNKGAKFHTFIHPTAIIGHNVKIGAGCIIDPYCVLYNDINIGDFVFISTSSVIGHDVVIGSYTSINIQSTVAGNNQIGNYCLLGVGVKTIPQCNIGDNTIIGAGSVVTKSIPANVTAFGIPARIRN